MCNDESNPTVTDCIFLSNAAYQHGGGIYNYQSSPDVTNCIFSGNTATSAHGGGMMNNYYSSPNVANCIFTSLNTAGGGGGGMAHSIGCNPIVTNCTFSGNVARDGGGMFNYSSNPTVINCTFTSNTGTSGGGGIHSSGGSPTVTNCILWGDTGGEIFLDDSIPVVTYSDVQGGWTGTGNIDLDPLFSDADGRLSPDSPCIDAGNDAAVPPAVTNDLDGNPRIQGACVDMGAFEVLADPEMMLAGLALFIMDEVDAGNIDAEMEVSLLAKVDAAIAALDRDNPNDAKVAMNDLKALVNQVEAQTDKKITLETAAEIIQRANDISAELGG
jgi:predicted outer membrane repeat protein